MSAPHVVFIPGLLCTAVLFAHQLEHLGEDFDVSVADTLSDASLGEMAERVLATAPGSFSLVGLSMGGYVAFEILARALERVERLILIDTSARADRDEQKAARRELVQLARADGLRAVNDTLFPRLVASQAVNDETLRARVDAMADHVGVERFAAQQEAIIARADQRERLTAFTVPTLVIVGAEDAITPPKVAEEMVARLPDARLETIADCGHLATMERPETVTRLLAEFLSPRQFEAGPKT